MDVQRLPLDGALVIQPKVFSDERGFFKEIYSAQRYAEAGVDVTFVQDNISNSRRGVLRGLHGDPRMAKLVQVIKGHAFDVVVDLREGSPTRLKWCSVEISADDHRQIYIPAGLLHGFLALSESVTLLYKQSAFYDPSAEIGIAWNDPDLAIEWPLGGRDPILSPKDAANPSLRASGRL